jgi:hypothetical protein
MATSHFFNNKVIKLPGAYATVRAEAPAAFASASYSKVLIINTNPDYAFGGSVNGQLTKGGDALYKFTTLPQAQAFFKTGYLWYLVQQLFRPSRLTGRQGISELQYINALTSTAPTITPTLASGSLVIGVKDESSNGNGVKINGAATDDRAEVNLKTGYALCIEAGVKDSSKYIVKIYQGTFKGNWSGDGLPYDGLSAESAQPEMVLCSPEISSVGEFVAWANSDETFALGFTIKSSTAGNFAAADITGNKNVLATGGTASYAAAQLTTAFEIMKKGDWNVILSLNKVGDTDADVINANYQHYVQSETRFRKYVMLAGSGTFSTDIAAAKACNSEFVWMVDQNPRKNSSLSPLGYREFDTLCMAALVTGRIVGLPPQVPGTFKDLDIDGLVNPLTDAQLEEALDAGLMTVNYDDDLEYFCITRAINTLQNNLQLQNPDGSTFSIQISRICTQLNTDVVVNAKKQIFGSNETANVFTVSGKYIENWTKSFLSSKIATPQQDNLIISVEGVSVEKKADAYFVTYGFKPNSEIDFLFFTGVAIY